MKDEGTWWVMYVQSCLLSWKLYLLLTARNLRLVHGGGSQLGHNT